MLSERNDAAEDFDQACVSLSVLTTIGFRKKSKEKLKHKQKNTKKQRQPKKAFIKAKTKELLSGMIEEVSKDLLKYWQRRMSLFTLFDNGIKCDEEGLFSVTPEEIAKQHAMVCGSGVVIIDGFAGVGGNAIQFASRRNHVVAIDIESKRVKCAQHNASLYGVSSNIDFLVGDFFQLAPSLKADVVFLAPPWGGPNYKQASLYDIETMLKPKNGFILFSVALSVAPSIVLFLPKTVDVEQLAQLAWLCNPPLPYKVEKNYSNGYVKALTIYYGEVACRSSVD